MMAVGTPALADAIRMLKIGTSKNDFPVYSQYVMSRGSYAFTYNLDVFVKVNYPFPWKGSVNLYVLEDTLKSLKDAQYNIEQVEDSLVITAGSFKSNIAITSVSPDDDKVEPDIEYYTLDKDVIEFIAQAARFVGGKIHQYIYLGDEDIIATDTESIYHALTNLSIKSPFGISRSILPLLSEGVKIGVDKNSNVAVNFGSGYALFSTDRMDTYPRNKLLDFLTKVSKKQQKICNFSYIGEAIKYLSPIFFGERERIVTLRNDGRSLVVSAETKVAGKSEYEIVSEMGDPFVMKLNINKFKNITYDYDVFYTDQSIISNILLDNGKSQIVIVGE